MISPIKTIIKNNTNSKYVFRTNNHRSFCMTAKGTDSDSIAIEGDIFSQFTNDRESEVIIAAMARGELSISYKIEKTFNCDYVEPGTCMRFGSANWDRYMEYANSLTEAKKETKPEAPVKEPEPIKEPEQVKNTEPDSQQPEAKPEPVEIKTDPVKDAEKTMDIKPVEHKQEIPKNKSNVKRNGRNIKLQ